MMIQLNTYATLCLGVLLTSMAIYIVWLNRRFEDFRAMADYRFTSLTKQVSTMQLKLNAYGKKKEEASALTDGKKFVITDYFILQRTKRRVIALNKKSNKSRADIAALEELQEAINRFQNK